MGTQRNKTTYTRLAAREHDKCQQEYRSDALRRALLSREHKTEFMDNRQVAFKSDCFSTFSTWEMIHESMCWMYIHTVHCVLVRKLQNDNSLK